MLSQLSRGYTPVKTVNILVMNFMFNITDELEMEEKPV